MKKGYSIILLVSFLMAACDPLGAQSTRDMPMNYGNNNGPDYNGSQGGQFASNGEQIYFTATDQSGGSITYTDGPGFGGMMGASLACVSCHGPQGRGGTNYMHMQTIDAPPIYDDALIQMKREDSGGTPQPAGYTLDDFRQAVVRGQDINGEQLDQNMPRWQMSDRDLQDLYNFVRSLQ